MGEPAKLTEILDTVFNGIRTLATVALALGAWIWQKRQARAKERDVAEKSGEKNERA